MRRRFMDLVSNPRLLLAHSPPEVIDGFSLLIRDELDVNTLVGDLLGVVDDTVAPAQRAIWIRE